MSACIDFAELKRRMKIEDVAKMLNLKLKASGNQLRGSVPAAKMVGREHL